MPWWAWMLAGAGGAVLLALMALQGWWEQAFTRLL